MNVAILGYGSIAQDHVRAVGALRETAAGRDLRLFEEPMRLFLVDEKNGIVWDANWTLAGAEEVPADLALDFPGPVSATSDIQETRAP